MSADGGGGVPVRGKGKKKDGKPGPDPDEPGANSIGHGITKAGFDKLLEWRMVRIEEDPQEAEGLYLRCCAYRQAGTEQRVCVFPHKYCHCCFPICCVTHCAITLNKCTST